MFGSGKKAEDVEKILTKIKHNVESLSAEIEILKRKHEKLEERIKTLEFRVNLPKNIR